MGFCNLTELEELFEASCNGIDKNNVSDLNVIVQNELTRYKNVVTNFFTDKADEIRFIYKSIRENAFPYNRIIASDSNQARHLYLEYFEGLKEYIDKLLDLKATDEMNIEKLGSSISQICTRDHDFVASIYAEEKNPKESMDINSAMKNVEVLIDVYNDSDMIRDTMNSYITKLNSADTTYSEQMAVGLKMMAKSILHFHKNIIKEILECYEQIHNSIQNRTPAMGEKVIETYQLF